MTYRVGQVLFVAPKDKPALIPIQIVEEIVKKTIAGSITSYMVSVKSSSGEEVVDLQKVSNLGELFETSESARKTLVKRAVGAVNNVVDRALEVAHARFPTGVESSSTPRPTDDFDAQDNEQTIVMLEDGTQVKANIHLPDSLK